MALPLDERSSFRKDPFTQVEKKVPDLDPAWSSEVSFLCYESPPQCRGDSSQAATDEWLERVEFIVEDVDWLLLQSHQLFWCQVIFDTSLQKLLDTFLASAPRPSDPVELAKPVQDAQGELHRRMFMVFLRLATHKESGDDFFTPSVFGGILYENYLFDIPKLIDLCALYGDEACFSAEDADDASHVSQLLRRMVGNVFTQQPAYTEDLSATTSSLLLATEGILQKLEGGGGAHSGNSLLDTVLYCYDVTSSLSLFCSIYEPACQVLLGAGMMERLLQIAAVLKDVLHRLGADRSVPASLSTFLSARLPTTCARLMCCFLFRSAQSTPDRRVVMSALNSISSRWPEMLARMDDYSAGMKQLLTAGLHGALGQSDVHSVVQNVQRACQSHPKQSAGAAVQNGSVQHGAATAADASSEAAAFSALQASAGPASVATASAQADPLARAVDSVLELLPDTDVELVWSAVRQANGNFERAVNMILEGRVTQLSLDDIPPAEEPPRSSKPAAAASAPASKSENARKATKFVLDGRGHDQSVVAIRATLDALESKEFEETIAGGYDEYDDEYDDTYDSHVVGDVPNASGEDRDEFVIRRLNQKAPLFRHQDSDSESDSGSEGDGEGDGSHAAAPANGGPLGAGRGTAHQHGGGRGTGRGGAGGGRGSGAGIRGGAGGGAQQRGGQRGGGGGRGRGRGRGTTPEERRAQQHKEQHKSSRANHNRKSGAGWKQRGMGGINAVPQSEK